MTRILTRADVAAVLALEDCIAPVEEVFRAYGERRVPQPRSLGIEAEGGAFHVKAAVTDVFAAKINANFPDNRERHDLPTIQGVIVVMDPSRGEALGVLDSTLITTFRTAAATAVAAKYLARRDSRTVAVIGCGSQGRANLAALRLVRPIFRAFAHDLDYDVAARFAKDMSAELDIEVVATSSIDDAISRSDVVVTCTPARAPILDLRHRRPGLFIAAVGADNPDKNELAPELLEHALVVPDVAEQAATMGDLHHAIAAGLLTVDDVHGELPAVICGRAPGRRTEEEFFVFDSTGTALQDAAVASVVLSRAAERGIGLEVALN